jgi:PAS domain S-box-containing protein
MSSRAELEAEVAALRRRLVEAEETLEAIAAGAVDAVVVSGPRGEQVYGLQSPDQPYRAFVERMAEGALSLAADGTILFANASFARLVGVPLEHVIGTPFERYVASACHVTLRALLEGGVAGGVRGTCELRTADDRAVPVHLSLGPLPASEHPTCCVVVTDMTERERLERMESARRAAEAASLAKDRFLAVLSHELRTPLNAILGWAQMLGMDATLGDEARYGVRVIERNARAQGQLINDLLDISRIIAGKMRLERRPVDLVSVAEAALESFEPLAQDRNIRVLRLLEVGVGDVVGDPDRLRQIVWNLLSNALKFTPAGGTVQVQLRRDGASVRLEVRDDGQGIEPELLARLFGIFEQGDPGTTRRTGGLGLGLAIVRQLTEMHGGHVEAFSAGAGRGSTFVVRIPAADGVGRAPIPELRSPEVRLDGVEVLLVDDDDDSRDLGRRLMALRGAHVATAATAREALEAIERVHPDVLVADLSMPEMDGFELVREIRARGCPAEELPAVALTAFAASEDRRRALGAGFQLYVAKPVDARELCASVARLVGRA